MEVFQESKTSPLWKNNPSLGGFPKDKTPVVGRLLLVSFTQTLQKSRPIFLRPKDNDFRWLVRRPHRS